MPLYNFTYIVDGVDPHAEDFEDRFFEAGCDDGLLGMINGAITVSFSREAESYAQATISALGNIVDAGAHAVRFEPDFLVNASDIANRAGVSRAAVSLYRKGERGIGFPAPSIRATSKNPLWDWVSVSCWLLQQDGNSIEEDDVKNAWTSRSINQCLHKLDGKGGLFEVKESVLFADSHSLNELVACA